MSFSVNTNIASLQAQNYLRTSSDFQSKTINRVTSGLRIVSSGDDAAGLAIANGFRSDQSVLMQGIRNANDGLSTLQTIDGGMNNISLLLDRARTLATQSASGGFTGSRSVLNSEFQSVMTEINRQAQSIGLNQSGEFAKALSVFIGGGKGVSSADAITNGSVTVDLSKSVVDTTALGLDSFKAVGSNYDLGANSSTSVKAILSNTGNSPTGTTEFTFTGAGFSGTDAITIEVNVAGVKDTESLMKAVNAAIGVEAAKVADNNTAFKNAGITASIVTDVNGRQQLAFSAPSSAFQVKAEDKVANALLGNIENSATGLGKTLNSYVTSGHMASATLAADVTYTYTINGTGFDVDQLEDDDIDAVVDAFNDAVAAAVLADDEDPIGNFQAVKEGTNQIRIESKDGSSFTLSGDADLVADFGLADESDDEFTVSTQANSVLSGGAKTSTQFADDKAFTFTAYTGSNTQDLTFAGTHSDGTQYEWTVNLGLAVAGTIDDAVNYVNSQLQASGDTSLQKIVAVKSADTAGALGIKFLSSDDFSVKFSDITGTQGFSDGSTGATAQGSVLYSATSAGSGLADISNQTTAAQAVGALAAAVQTLGNAQAVVGKGQNNFNFAINLAQSQVSNLAAAESRLRDADLASEAANLTKAQILIQAGTAALAQANSAPQAVLSLLRG